MQSFLTVFKCDVNTSVCVSPSSLCSFCWCQSADVSCKWLRWWHRNTCNYSVWRLSWAAWHCLHYWDVMWECDCVGKLTCLMETDSRGETSRPVVWRGNYPRSPCTHTHTHTGSATANNWFRKWQHKHITG